MEPGEKLVADFFADARAAQDLAERPLPSPHLIWWKAQIERRCRVAERSMAPVRIMQSGAVAAGVAVVLLAIPASGVWWIAAAAAISLAGIGAICAKVLV